MRGSGPAVCAAESLPREATYFARPTCFDAKQATSVAYGQSVGIIVGNGPGGMAALGSPAMDTPLNRFDAWIAALSAGYVPLERFVAWADQRIVADACQPRWVLDLSLCTDAEQAEQVLWEEWAQLERIVPDQVSAASEPGDMHLGFLYLMFRDGRLSTAEMLERAGIYTDGPGYFCIEVSCESFFYLLNEIDGGGPTVKSDRPLEERVDELFAPFAAAARAVLGELPAEPAPT